MTIDNTFKNYLNARHTLFEERFNQAINYLNSVYHGVCIFIYKPVSQMGNNKPMIDHSHIRLGVIEYSNISNKPYLMYYGLIKIDQSYDNFITDLNHRIQYALKHVKHN